MKNSKLNQKQPAKNDGLNLHSLVLFFLFTMIGLFSTSCEKDNNNDDAILKIKTELKNLAVSTVDIIEDTDPCNELNPYDAWGESVYNGVSTLLYKNTGFAKTSYDRKNFEDQLRKDLPAEYQTIDITNVNLDNAKLICDEFLSLYIKRNIHEAIVVSKKMESYVLTSKKLTDSDKAYILKFVSLIRFSTFLNSSFRNMSKGITDRTFEECWRDTLQGIQDGGPFQKIACVIDWPMCLSLILADCAYEQLTQ